MAEYLDLSGVASFYVNEVQVSDAGSGHMRYLCGHRIGKTFVPQYVAVIPLDATYVAYGQAKTLLDDIRANGH